MKQDKFWLVWSPQGTATPTESFYSKKLAKQKARELSNCIHESDFYVFEATHHYKAYEHKFKVGDVVIVNAAVSLFEIVNKFGTKYTLSHKKTGDIFDDVCESKLRMAKESKAKFKVGDKVNVFDEFTQQTVLCTVEKTITDDSGLFYEIKNNHGTDIKAEIYLTHA